MRTQPFRPIVRAPHVQRGRGDRPAFRRPPHRAVPVERRGQRARLGEPLDVPLDLVRWKALVEPPQPAPIEQLALGVTGGPKQPEILRALLLVGIAPQRGAEGGAVRGRDGGEAAQAVWMGGAATIHATADPQSWPTRSKRGQPSAAATLSTSPTSSSGAYASTSAGRMPGE